MGILDRYRASRSWQRSKKSEYGYIWHSIKHNMVLVFQERDGTWSVVADDPVYGRGSLKQLAGVLPSKGQAFKVAKGWMHQHPTG